MKNTDIHFQSATELVSALANQQISSVELVEKTIERIELLDDKINAVVVRDFDNARTAAKKADEAIAQGKQLPLLGLPITVKESFSIRGIPTTWGNPAFKNWVPDFDSLVVTRLKEAGAIIIGKTNVPLMLHDWQTFNEMHGVTNNPWDFKVTPGGSSGGSAAALAAGFVSLELGSDFAGSVRVPASFCGVFGHKPSVHLIPIRGAGPPKAPPSPDPLVDLVAAGPLARTAADLKLALDVLAGPDETWDGKGYKLSLPTPRHDKLSDFRVLIINEHPLCPTSNVVKKAIDDLGERFKEVGSFVSTDTQLIANLAEITQIYTILFSAFTSGTIPFEEYQQVLTESNLLDKNDNSISACMLRGLSITHRHWLTAMKTRNALRDEFRSLYNDFDVIITPAMPTPAFPHDFSDRQTRKINIDGELFPYRQQFAWSSIASVFGFPATVIPTGFTDDELPIGVQVIGDYLEDYTTIKFAELFEREFGGFTPPAL